MSDQQAEKVRDEQISNAAFIEGAIKTYVRESPLNRLPSFDNEPIFDEPLIGFADADDPLFREYKSIIGEFHQTPREAFEAGLKERGIPQRDTGRLSVVSWVLPITLATRLGMRRESVVPTLRWNHTRFQGQAFIEDLSRHLISVIEQRGCRAVAPEIVKNFEYKIAGTDIVSNWSQRHVAYAAGLGTFSLNDGFITPRGIAMRLGSIVTDLDLPVSGRPYADRRSNCLFFRNGSCGRCMKRCPAGAITEHGHDKNKCVAYLYKGSKDLLKQMGRFEGFIGVYPACGLCQNKVPCESMIPPDMRRPV